MKKNLFVPVIFILLFTACSKKNDFESEMKAESTARITSQDTNSKELAYTSITSATTFSNESSADYDGLTNPRPIVSIPGFLNRTLWGTYDSDWQSFSAIDGTTYTVTVTNYDQTNTEANNRFRIEVWSGVSPNFTFLYRTADGVFSTQFIATESTKYIINLRDGNSDLNSASLAVGDYTITVTSNGIVQVPPVQLSSVAISPATIKGGNVAVGSISLSAPAPSGGITVLLNSSISIVHVPSSLFIAAGNSSGKFNVTTSKTNKNKSAVISAMYNGVTKNASIVVTK